jgi:hypothetical protein
MKNLELNIPTLGFVIVTRAMLGAGIGLLLSARIPEAQRKAIALTLIGVGVVTTIPALFAVREGLQAGRLKSAAV